METQDRKRVVVSGSSGLIGSAVVEHLASAGYEVQRLVRRPPKLGEVFWDPDQGKIDHAGLEGAHAVVHLAGKGITEQRWNPEVKAEIRRSRVEGTRLLTQALARLESKPQVLVSASAIGYYGDRGAEPLTEASPPGTGFLAEVSKDWEEATRAASAVGIRVVNLRIGVVLSKEGGALAKMLPPFRLGLGGPVGRGDQYLSWIARSDLARVIQFLLEMESVSGPVNATAPNPVTSRDFATALGHALHRPAIAPIPGFALKLLYGEMGGTLLEGQRVLPKKLQEAGFHFNYPDVASALAAEL